MRPTPCPCGLTAAYADCCGRYLDSPLPAPTAEALMRSRYTAYTLLREDYLLTTWHPDTRPASLSLNDPPTKWLGLTVHAHQQQDADHATVEFTARYKISGRALRLHELSRFVRLEGKWWYVEGEL